MYLPVSVLNSKSAHSRRDPLDKPRFSAPPEKKKKEKKKSVYISKNRFGNYHAIQIWWRTRGEHSQLSNTKKLRRRQRFERLKKGKQNGLCQICPFSTGAALSIDLALGTFDSSRSLLCFLVSMVSSPQRRWCSEFIPKIYSLWTGRSNGPTWGLQVHVSFPEDCLVFLLWRTTERLAAPCLGSGHKQIQEICLFFCLYWWIFFNVKFSKTEVSNIRLAGQSWHARLFNPGHLTNFGKKKIHSSSGYIL